MATLYGAQMTRVNAGTPTDPGFVDGSKRSFVETVTYAAQAASDTIEVARLPKGAAITGARIVTSVTTGTAQFAIGVSGSTGKYRASAVFTAADTWEELGDTTTLHTALTAEEIVFITIANAALPASGTLLVQFDYSFN